MADGATLHLLLEAIAYLVGVQWFLRLRRRQGAPIPPDGRGLLIMGAAIFGAALGSKLVFWLQYPSFLLGSEAIMPALLGGKTLVGGLLGGLAGVELAKRATGISRSTGDLFVFPLLAGIVIGRVGCFLTGLGDNTHGASTTLPWGHDYGDGIPRHPAQIYEIAFLLAIWPVLARLRARLPRAGDLFRLFMVSYLGWRLVVDFLKPPFGETIAALPQLALADRYPPGLTGIQLACLAGLAYYARDGLRIARTVAWRS